VSVAIVGCGVIGKRRAHAFQAQGIAWCIDIDIAKARALSALFPGSQAHTSIQAALDDSAVTIIAIATLHHALSELAALSIAQGKHVLIEKPGAISAAQIKPLIAQAKEKGVVAHVGFNHRYHRAFQKAYALYQDGAIGELMYIRARYGHGGRLGYDQEWRANPVLSGGGELIDQGVHLIDLARWFLGDFTHIAGQAHTYYWTMPVDDNVFMHLTTQTGQTAFLHASCTEWKNLFSFEIYGRLGKLDIQGLGGSYGLERLTYYKMLAQMGPPETCAWEYPMVDNSWEVETADFLAAIKHQRPASVSLEDAYAALVVVDQIYKVSSYDYCT